MRILHIDTGRELRGGQRQALLLVRGLVERGHDCVLLARKGAPLYAAALECGFETRPANALNVAREARQADLVHAHDAHAHSLGALAAGGCPLVVSRRVAFPVGTGFASRWKYERADRFVAISQFVKNQLLAAGIPEENIGVVFDGIELPPGAPPIPRENFVLAPATADAQKGSDLASEACRLAGVELRFSADLGRDLPRAALFLYLTRSEGLGSAILLAMSHRTPVVASRVGGIPEVVTDGETGVLVENDAAAIAAALRAALGDPAATAARAEAAFAAVAARFTDAKMVRETEQQYAFAVRSGVPCQS